MAARRRGNGNFHLCSQDEIDRLRSVPLPEKIKCNRCNKIVAQARYSEKQLTDYRWQISKGVRDPQHPNCQKCAGGNQLVELECQTCHKTKGLEDFAKRQRAVPDDAQCFKCTDEQVTHQPYDEEKYEDASKPFVTADTSNGVMPDYWSSSGSTYGSSTSGDWATVNGDTTESEGGVRLSNDFQRAMSLNGSVSDSLIGSEYSTYPNRANNGNGSEIRTGSWHTGSAGPTSTIRAGSSSSSSNLKGDGRLSATSDAGTLRTYASSRVERSEASDIRPNGWAKIRAYKAPSSLPQGVPSPIDSQDATLSAGPVHSSFVRPAGDAQRETEADTDPWGYESGGDEEYESGSDDSDGDNTVI